MTVTPAANRNGGPVTITLAASDGALSASSTFTVTVTPVNDPPTISNITDRTVEPDTSTGTIGFTVSDPDGDTPLTVTASTSDTRVVPTAGISLGGSGGNRNIAILPGANQGGASTITVTVNDGHGGTARDTFVLSAKVKLSANVVGSGSVAASGTGCPGTAATCAALPGAGTVTFVATPDPGAVFVRWTGGCSGTGNGTVSPIPTAGVTCTANFRNLWARLMHTPTDVAQQLQTSAAGVVETPKGLHYLGGMPGRGEQTAIAWNANLDTGAVTAGTAFAFTQDGASLSPVALLRDGADGTVALINGAAIRGTALLWLDETNQLVRARSYEAGGTVQRQSTGFVRNIEGGLAFVETSHDTSPVAVFPTFGQLVRLSATGDVVGGTRYLEGLGNCTIRTTTRNVTPYALAQNADGSYLVAGSVPALVSGDPPSGAKMNLTLFDASGVPVWGRHIEPTPVGRTVLPLSVTANGSNFLVTGAMTDAKASFDGFALLISRDGNVQWWKSFGDDGAVDVAFRGVARGTGFVFTGYAPTPAAGDYDVFVAGLGADGAAVRGMMYGGAGVETGNWLIPAANGGFNVFGSSTDSFGNELGSAWALRIDESFHITFQTGSLSAYEPMMKDETPSITNTCTGATVYAQFTPTMQTLNASATPITLGGAYQANP